jgi:hypothetical protein
MRVLRTVWAALREIFDESAYERFLQLRGLPRSRDSYALFQLERRAAQERRPRCC